MKINLFERSRSFESDFQITEIMDRLATVSDSKMESTFKNQVKFLFSSSRRINFLSTNDGFVVWLKERGGTRGFYLISGIIKIQEKKTIIETKTKPDFLSRLIVLLLVGGCGISILIPVIYQGIHGGFTVFIKFFIIGFLLWSCIGLAFKLVDSGGKKGVFEFLEQLVKEGNNLTQKNKI